MPIAPMTGMPTSYGVQTPVPSQPASPVAYVPPVVPPQAPVTQAPQNIPPEPLSLKSSPKDFFMYMAAYVFTLTIFFDILTIVFRVIDHAFPLKAVAKGSFSVASMISSASSMLGGFPTTAVSSLIFVLPALGILARMLLKDIALQPARSQLFVRVLSLSAILYVTSFFMLGSLTSLMYFFIEDDATTALIVKTITGLILALGMGWYYVRSLRRDYTQPSMLPTIFYSLSATLAVVLIIVAFGVFGRPISPTKIAADTTSSRSLQSLTSVVDAYIRKTNSLPENLSSLSSSEYSSYMYSIDKTFLTSVTYTITTPLVADGNQLTGEYKLCATFNAVSDASSNPYSYGVVMVQHLIFMCTRKETNALLCL